MSGEGMSGAGIALALVVAAVYGAFVGACVVAAVWIVTS